MVLGVAVEGVGEKLLVELWEGLRGRVADEEALWEWLQEEESVRLRVGVG